MTKFDLRKQDCTAGMSRLSDESVDLVMTSRKFFVLQNTIHWIKSIAIDTNETKTDARHPHLNLLSALPGRDPNPDAKRRVRVEGGLKTFGHFKPINSTRFLNDCHEYVFH